MCAVEASVILRHDCGIAEGQRLFYPTALGEKKCDRAVRACGILCGFHHWFAACSGLCIMMRVPRLAASCKPNVPSAKSVTAGAAAGMPCIDPNQACSKYSNKHHITSQLGWRACRDRKHEAPEVARPSFRSLLLNFEVCYSILKFAAQYRGVLLNSTWCVTSQLVCNCSVTVTS